MNVKELAFEAGFTITPCGLFEAEDTNLEHFAELVRADEREVNAKLCENASLYFIDDQASASYAADYCANEIRAMGEK
jgi:hypothetical protein